MSTPCPERSLWLALSHGRLDEAQLAPLGAHLETCGTCMEVLSGLDDEQDELLSELSCLLTKAEADRSEIPPDLIVSARRALAGSLGETARGLADSIKDGPVQVGRFELIRSLGVGSFGHVFLAEDRSLEREVAIKVQRSGVSIDGEQEQRFLREARSAARLQHPAIVGLYETGRTKSGVPYLVSEFVPGETLEERLELGALPPRPAAKLVAIIARALAYAHEQGIVHRDIKPSNVLLDSLGRPHLSDFGLAKRERAGETLTPQGEVLGTPAYLSPEMAAGNAHQADARSDIYSLGVVLYEVLTGQRPFQGHGRALLLCVLEEDPKRPRQILSSLPRDLETVCLKAMCKSPGARYQSALEFAEDLERFLHGVPIVASRRSLPVRLWQWGLREPLAASLVLAACLGSVTGFAHLFSVSRNLVRSSALDSAAQYADMLEVVNEVYSQEVVDKLGHHGVEVTADYASRAGSIPLPATMLTVLLGRIEERGSGMGGRHYSNWPFKFRQDGGPRDAFETQALASLSAEPTLPFYRFTEDAAGKPVLRYTRARVMRASCVSCHNSHPDSPKRDWIVGDVRGVLEVVRSLDRDEGRIRTGLRSTFALVGAVTLLMLTLGLGAHFLTQRKRERRLGEGDR